MRMQLLLFFLLVTVQCVKDTNREPLEVTLSATYGPNEVPDLQGFRKNLSQLDDFELVAFHAHRTKGAATIALKLQPRREGELIFAPGLFTVSDETGRQYFAPIESFSIESVPLQGTLQLHPPLPVRPEEAMKMDSRNTNETRAYETIERVDGHERQLVRFDVLRAIQLILFLSGIFILLMWAIIHYEIRLPKKRAASKIDLKQMFEALMKSTEPLDVRLKQLVFWIMMALSQQYGRSFLESTVQEIIDQLRKDQKEQIEPFLLHIERAEFQLEKLEEAEWQQLIEQAKRLSVT